MSRYRPRDWNRSSVVWSAVSSPGGTSPLTMDLLNQFVALASAMSPENLHWDGERSPVGAARALRGLKAKWKRLEVKAGRPVTDSEVWALWTEIARARTKVPRR